MRCGRGWTFFLVSLLIINLLQKVQSEVVANTICNANVRQSLWKCKCASGEEHPSLLLTIVSVNFNETLAGVVSQDTYPLFITGGATYFFNIFLELSPPNRLDWLFIVKRQNYVKTKTNRQHKSENQPINEASPRQQKRRRERTNPSEAVGHDEAQLGAGSVDYDWWHFERGVKASENAPIQAGLILLNIEGDNKLNVIMLFGNNRGRNYSPIMFPYSVAFDINYWLSAV